MIGGRWSGVERRSLGVVPIEDRRAESGIVHFANHIGTPGLRGSGKRQKCATGAPCGYSRKCLLLATSNGGLMGEDCRDSGGRRKES